MKSRLTTAILLAAAGLVRGQGPVDFESVGADFDNIRFGAGGGGTGGGDGGRDLIVDGAPFVVRGVCYQPTPIGQNPSQSPPYGDYYTAGYAALYERDLANLRAMGANLVRVYGWDTTAGHGGFLDQCWNGGVDPIRVLVNRWINPQTNWASPSAVSAVAGEFTSINSRLGSHPAVLGIILGNEANIENGNGTNPAFWSAMNTIAGAIKAQTPSRKVSVAITDALSQVAAFDASLTNIDFWSVQVYRGLSFGTFFNQYAAASTKPLIVTEFGVDAYNATTGSPYPDNGAFVADAVAGLWADLEANGAIAAGACVFEYTDEWWKGGNPSVHDTGGFAMGGLPDGFANEEWWGIFAVAPTPGGGLDTLTPRALYARLQSIWIPAAVDPPVISSDPVGQSLGAGGTVTLSVAAAGAEPLGYQWRRDDTDIAGATDPDYTIPSVQAFHAGAYSVVVTNPGGSTTSGAANLEVQPLTASASRLMNLSTRALCLTGDDLLIPGFVVEGGGTKRFLIRAVGPRLGDFGVADTLPDPQMVLKRREGENWIDQAANDDWGDNANAAEIAAAAEQVGAFELAGGSGDAALLLDLAPGGYSVVNSDTAGRTGVAIVELYDADEAQGAARLVNISNRGFVGTGENIMIPGFVVSEEGPKTFLMRAVGPGLAEFGVVGLLEDPKLTIFQRIPGDPPEERMILWNDNWGENGDGVTVSQVAEQAGAFELMAESSDAAFVVTLPPGVYTVQAAGADGSTGVALVEVYVVL